MQKSNFIKCTRPNEANPQFYTRVQHYVSDIGNANVICCGDWNLVLNPALDSENYRNINNRRARDELSKIIEENGYTDVWRVQNKKKSHGED